MHFNFSDVVLDIETLAVKPGAVVLSAGVLAFDINTINTFDELIQQGINIIFNTEVQVEAGLKVDPGTLEFWKRQMAEHEFARLLINGEGAVHPREFYTVLDTLLPAFSLSTCRWFARGPHFDMAILETMLDKFNVSPPWRYYMPRDARTYIEALGFDPQGVNIPEPAGFKKHSALHDCAMEAMRLQSVTSEAAKRNDEKSS